MGYVTFNALRMDLAYVVSNEFGLHYGEMPKACAGLINVDLYNARTEALIKKYKLKERFLSFFFQDDIQGQLSPFKCKALLDGINDLKSNQLYGYKAYPEECMSLDDFKALLEECFARKKYLFWL